MFDDQQFAIYKSKTGMRMYLRSEDLITLGYTCVHVRTRNFLVNICPKTDFLSIGIDFLANAIIQSLVTLSHRARSRFPQEVEALVQWEVRHRVPLQRPPMPTSSARAA